MTVVDLWRSPLSNQLVPQRQLWWDLATLGGAGTYSVMEYPRHAPGVVFVHLGRNAVCDQCGTPGPDWFIPVIDHGNTRADNAQGAIVLCRPCFREDVTR